MMILTVFTITSLIATVMTAKLEDREVAPSNESPWMSPDGRTLDEWAETGGQSSEDYEKMKELLAEIRRLVITEDRGDGRVAMDNIVTGSENETRLDPCVTLTVEQAQLMVDAKKPHPPGTHSRTKRKFDSHIITNKWDMPIKYKFDGKHSLLEKEMIRDAARHWMHHTCVVFEEVPTAYESSDNHIIITKRFSGCHSYVGKVKLIPQQLNLQSRCTEEFGIPVHEFAHALGVWHEQQRSDRDDHIKINWDNLGSYVGQFYKFDNTEHFGVPYDISSVMHYHSTAGTLRYGVPTIETLDPEFQDTLGQRTGLSFLDAKIVNMAYCADICHVGDLRGKKCQNEGYQNPKQCDSCLCPDGLTGQYCEEIEPSVNGVCGGEITLDDGDVDYITSPGYFSWGYYDEYQECTWLVKVPAGYNILLEFIDEFGIYCHKDDRCYHWLEMRYKDGIGITGPRICCSQPGHVYVGELGEVMLLFRSNFPVEDTGRRRGFHIRITTERKPGFVPTTTSLAPVPSDEVDCDNMDLIFLLDSSGSVSEQGWDMTLTFVSRMVEKIPLSPDESRVGVISFSNKAHLDILLTDFYDHDDFEDELRDIKFQKQWTSTSSALNMATSQLTANRRPGKTQVVIIVTDGKDNVALQEDIEEAAQDAYDAGIVVYVLAVGGKVDMDQAREFAGSEDRVTEVSSYRHLSRREAVDDIYDVICAGDSQEESEESEEEEVDKSTWACDFESEESDGRWCEMDQVQSGDDFDWTRRSGSTRSSQTGPDRAHQGDYYIFIEASKPRIKDDEAIILVPGEDRKGTYCVSFYFSMHGLHMGALQLLVETQERYNLKWQMEGDLGELWLYQEYTVQLNIGDRVAFRGIRGKGYSGDAAIDALKVQYGACLSGNDVIPDRDAPAHDAMSLETEDDSDSGTNSAEKRISMTTCYMVMWLSGISLLSTFRR